MTMPDAMPDLGLSAEEVAVAASIKPPRRGKLTKIGIDQQLLNLYANLLDEMKTASRYYGRAEKTRRRIVRLLAQRMNATDPAALTQRPENADTPPHEHPQTDGT
jgi:hypothetical protein